MKSKLVLGCLLVSSLMLSGCTDPAAMLLLTSGLFNKKSDDKPPKLVCTNGVAKMESNDGAGTGIIGGQALDKDSWLARGIVFIVQVHVKDGKKEASMCTGTLVDDNMVLTAAHCVNDARYDYSENIKVFFTNQPECDMDSGQLKGVSRDVDGLKIHPNYSPSKTFKTARGDVALIRLADKAPKGFFPLKLAKDYVEMSPSKEVYLAGYGMTNVDYKGEYSVDNEGIFLRLGKTVGITETMRSELIRALTDEIRDKGGSVTAEVDSYADNKSTNEVLFIDQSQGRGVCAGDSGGPSLMKNNRGMYVVTGVASFVINPDNEQALCGFAAAHSSVSYFRGWIDSSFESLKNSNSTKNSLFE